MYRIEIFKGNRRKGKKEKWYSRIVCKANGQTLWTSQGYARKSNCTDTAEVFRLRAYSRVLDIVEVDK